MKTEHTIIDPHAGDARNFKNNITMANKILELVDDDNDSTNLLNPDSQDSYYFSDEDLDDWERSLEREEFHRGLE